MNDEGDQFSDINVRLSSAERNRHLIETLREFFIGALREQSWTPSAEEMKSSYLGPIEEFGCELTSRLVENWGEVLVLSRLDIQVIRMISNDKWQLKRKNIQPQHNLKYYGVHVSPALYRRFFKIYNYILFLWFFSN